MVWRLSTATRNSMANAFRLMADAGSGPGHIRFYTGSQPASANSAATGTLLADINLADPAFAAATSGGVALNEVAPDSADTAGSAGWFRLLDSDNNVVADGTVTGIGGGGDIEVSNTNFAVAQVIDIVGGGVISVASGE